MTNSGLHIIKRIWKGSLGDCQTLFTSQQRTITDANQYSVTESLTYGINGSIRKRYDHQTQNTDYYYFNASGNLKACGTDMQISLYGYNASNTRTYKVNLFNANQWVNGQPQPIQPMVQNAMFYPNTYLNFNQNGEYTKHYYNGTERICSRLGEQQIPISVENDQELLNYQHDTKEILRNAIGQHLYDEPTDMQEGEVLHLDYLQPCGNSNAVFYYHPNHLASTMYVTDMQQSVVQSFLYAPYGEIISEYNTHVMGEALPKYAFNAKELDEETGMYYYEARYYNPPVFVSRDPMFEKYFWMSPYAYCANNPMKYVDPSGEEGIVVTGSPGKTGMDQHFLINGFDRAKRAQKRAIKGECTTWIIYNDKKQGFKQKYIDNYTAKARKAGINVKVVSDVNDITDYINYKNGGDSRKNDKISSFYYVGHATPGDLDVGYQGSGQNFDPSDLNNNAFKNGAWVNVVGGCRTAVDDKFLGMTIEKSIIKQFADILDSKSKIHGSDVRVFYLGGVAADESLLRKNKGHIITINGRNK